MGLSTFPALVLPRLLPARLHTTRTTLRRHSVQETWGTLPLEMPSSAWDVYSKWLPHRELQDVGPPPANHAPAIGMSQPRSASLVSPGISLDWTSSSNHPSESWLGTLTSSAR